MRSPPPSIRLLPAVLLLATVGCELPRYDGPQVQSPPPGFTLNPNTSLDRTLFPERPVIYHDAWVRAQWGDFSGIYINGFPGSTAAGEVEAARQAALAVRANREDQVLDFSAVEPLTIDGRDALGWSEVVRSPDRGIETVAYRAVVPYDTISYTVEFVSGDPAFKTRTDSLRAIVASFGVGRVRINYPLFLILAGALLFFVTRARARSKDRQLRHASMSLPKIERKEPGEGGSGGAGAPPAGGGARPAASTPRPSPPAAQGRPAPPSTRSRPPGATDPS